ncbi:MAG: hypothetical protein JXR48_00235 [Candidatus Delongbacteria bacterium]|nr:hypothetical protein [Candidatus Delongbacteria bacterium]
MGVKEIIKSEKDELQNFNRPYEPVAFIVLAVLIFQQLVFLVKNLIDFADLGWFSTASFASANLQGFVSRIVGINSTSVLFIILGIIAWLAYYVVLYLLVWKFAKTQKLAKWTWTLFVAFGPTIFLAPPFIWFILYVYRDYIIRFFKKVVNDFKEKDEVVSNEEN